MLSSSHVSVTVSPLTSSARATPYIRSATFSPLSPATAATVKVSAPHSLLDQGDDGSSESLIIGGVEAALKRDKYYCENLDLVFQASAGSALFLAGILMNGILTLLPFGTNAVTEQGSPVPNAKVLLVALSLLFIALLGAVLAKMFVRWGSGHKRELAEAAKRARIRMTVRCETRPDDEAAQVKDRLMLELGNPWIVSFLTVNLGGVLLYFSVAVQLVAVLLVFRYNICQLTAFQDDHCVWITVFPVGVLSIPITCVGLCYFSKQCWTNLWAFLRAVNIHKRAARILNSSWHGVSVDKATVWAHAVLGVVLSVISWALLAALLGVFCHGKVEC